MTTVDVMRKKVRRRMVRWEADCYLWGLVYADFDFFGNACGNVDGDDDDDDYDDEAASLMIMEMASQSQSHPL